MPVLKLSNAEILSKGFKPCAAKAPKTTPSPPIKLANKNIFLSILFYKVYNLLL